MNIFILGKWGGTARWAEDCVEDLRFAGHTVHTFSTRNPKISRSLERLLLSPALGAPLSVRLIRRMRRLKPDLILGIGAYDDVSEIIFRRLSSLPDRPPLVAWIGDVFTATRADIANSFDLVAYTDTGFVDLHDRLGFSSRRAFIPLAANRARLTRGVGVTERIPRLAFVAAPTQNRRELLGRLDEPIDVYGPGWGNDTELSPHTLEPRLVGGDELGRIYSTRIGVLNIRNDDNVINGMNQRHFAPYLYGTPVISDHQRDISGHLEPGVEILLYDNAERLTAICRKVRRDPQWALSIGDAGRRRVLAHHAYAHRLEAIGRLLGLPGAATS
jgi:spore maturation protein CgeB